MEIMGKMKQILIFALLFFEIGYFFACDNSLTPLSPDSESEILTKSGPGKDGNGDVDPNPNSELLMVRRREEAEDGMSTALIGPAGGVLQHADHRVVVPAGALSQTIELTFSMPVSDTLLFELGPDGIQFNTPVQVIFNWDHAFTHGLPEDGFTVTVWNPDDSVWENVTTAVDTELDEATGDTYHFSKYSIRK